MDSSNKTMNGAMCLLSYLEAGGQFQAMFNTEPGNPLA